MKMKKQTVIYLAAILLSVAFVLVGNLICRPPALSEGIEDYYRAKVLEVGNVEEAEFSLDDGEAMVSNKRIEFTAEMINGPYKGDKVEALQDIDDMYAYQPKDVEVGDEVLLARPSYDLESGELGGDSDWVLIEHNRIGKIIWFVIAFFLLIIFIGHRKGLTTILALLFTVLAIFLVYIPGILKGYNIYVLTVVVSIFTIISSLIIINGWNFKTFCAISGNIIGVAFAGLTALIMSKAFRLTGMVEQNYVMLTQLETPIDLLGVIWGGVLIGALGAIMDVAMSIASAMKELNDTMSNKTFFRMLRSGMNIGRDAIGTMTNTLILAYIGGALASVLLLTIHQNIYYLFNMEMILVEILSAIAGSIGILAAVPATALISAFVFNRYTEKE